MPYYWCKVLEASVSTLAQVYWLYIWPNCKTSLCGDWLYNTTFWAVWWGNSCTLFICTIGIAEIWRRTVKKSFPMMTIWVTVIWYSAILHDRRNIMFASKFKKVYFGEFEIGLPMSNYMPDLWCCVDIKSHCGKYAYKIYRCFLKLP